MKDAIKRFKQYVEQRYPDRSTSKHYMSDLAIFHQHIGDVQPQMITPTMVSDFVETQSNQGLKGATINRRLSALSSFFEFLIFESEDDNWSNPVHWKRHSIRPGHHLPRDVSDQTVSQLLAVIEDRRDRAMFGLMIKAGLRVGEVVDLQLNDLHPLEQNGLARLRLRGKGDKERIVWLTAEVVDHIQHWLQQRPQSESAYLFLNQHGRPLSVSGVQFRLKQYCHQAGVQLSCHQLRHTFARRLVEHNMPIDSLAKLLGHNDLQTTQRYIDGADPTVRTDFLEAMQQVAQLSASPLKQTSDGPAAAAFVASQPDGRPDPVALVDALNHLAADLPDWLSQQIRAHTLRRIPRWQPHRAKSQTQIVFSSLCEGWTSPDWLRVEKMEEAKKRNQSIDWLR